MICDLTLFLNVGAFHLKRAPRCPSTSSGCLDKIHGLQSVQRTFKCSENPRAHPEMSMFTPALMQDQRRSKCTAASFKV